MEYTRRFEIVGGREMTLGFQGDLGSGKTRSIPADPENPYHVQMMTEVAAGTSTLFDMDVTHIPDYAELRLKAYGPIQDQLDMIYWDGENGTTIWRDHIASVKAAHPKPA